MYHKQLVNHVFVRQKEGISIDEIKNDLIKDGWSLKDVNEAIYYSSYPENLNHFSFYRILHSEIPTIITVTMILISIIISVSLFVIFKDTTLSYNINITTPPEESHLKFNYGEQPSLSNPDYFQKIKQQFINDKANFIEADLSAMLVKVYKSGILLLEVPINTKGKEGSWWETPAGIYKINNKEKDHFSSMGHVWMPWSMNFQGNFFIHGKTYYPDGTPTSAQFTGGCIRLSTEDAQKVFNDVEIGTPVLVFEHSFSSDGFQYKNEANPPISASSFLSADLLSNHIFTNKESTKKLPIASLTKLMTALIATEYINLDNTATVPKEALIYTSKPRLNAGEKYSIYQLLFPLLMESSNESAETIARYYGRDDFIKHMNEKAISIGMLNTNFSDPSGASAENTSTTEDLFMLTKYIYNNRSFIFNITSGKIKNSAYGNNNFTDLGKINDFIDNEFFFGGKNGKTTVANETNISVFELPVGEIKRPIVFIVLDSTNEKNDIQTLIDYTLNNFK